MAIVILVFAGFPGYNENNYHYHQLLRSDVMEQSPLQTIVQERRTIRSFISKDIETQTILNLLNIDVSLCGR